MTYDINITLFNIVTMSDLFAFALGPGVSCVEEPDGGQNCLLDNSAPGFRSSTGSTAIRCGSRPIWVCTYAYPSCEIFPQFHAVRGLVQLQP